MRYYVGVDRRYALELCLRCYEKMMPRDAVVILEDAGGGDPGPHHVDCFEEEYGVRINQSLVWVEGP